ncbi:MAG: zf-HC2 domain-containing protein [Deltaproteobacteria bacterium]|nr:zf-HC2 domain-containing protein [Deltaproteobacteria bacterium]
MSCFSEELYSVYVDGELVAGELRKIEAHLIQCRTCRATVVALREEASLLSQVLQERVRRRARPVAAHQRARGLVIGLTPALGIAALILVVGGWLLETRLPSGVSWLNPIQLIGVYEMFFDALFMIRDRVPELFEFAVAVGALASVASILTFLTSALVRRVVGPAALALFFGAASLVSLPSAPATALQLRVDEEHVTIGSGERVSETLFISAESVDIDGVIDGDLVVMAHRISIRGTVEGIVVAAGRSVEVTGTVDGSLIVVGENVRIEGKIDDDLYGAAEDLSLHSRSSVERDATLVGENVRVEGRTGRDVFALGETIEVRGEMGRDLITRSMRVALLDGARIARDFDYQLPEGEDAAIAAGSIIGGERREGVWDRLHHERENRWTELGFYMRSLVFLVSVFLVGMLLHFVWPDLFTGALPKSSDFFRQLGVGFLVAVAVPAMLVVCVVTVVGIPIGVLGTFGFLTALFVSMILVAALLGSSILRVEPRGAHGFGMALLLGLVVLWLATQLPFIGLPLRILAMLTGLGMLVTQVERAFRSRRERAAI